MKTNIRNIDFYNCLLRGLKLIILVIALVLYNLDLINQREDQFISELDHSAVQYENLENQP